MKYTITEVQIIPIKPQNGLLAIASFVFDNSLFCGSVGIYTRINGGYRLTYPTRKTFLKSSNVFYPINKDVASEIEKVVIAKFEEVMKAYDRHNSPYLE